MQELDAKKIAQTEFCVSSSDGHKLHGAIHDLLSADGEVVVSFANVRRVTTAFLNSAVGQLYNDFDYDFVDRNVKFNNLTPQISSLIDRVRRRAKEYFSADPKIIGKIRESNLED